MAAQDTAREARARREARRQGLAVKKVRSRAWAPAHAPYGIQHYSSSVWVAGPGLSLDDVEQYLNERKGFGR